MRILFVVPYVPGPVRTRSYNFVRSLAEKGHQITLFTLWENDDERDQLSAMREICHRVVALHQPRGRIVWNMVAGILSNEPLQAVYSWQPALAQELVGLLQSDGEAPVDVIHVEHLRAARYALLAKELGAGAPRHKQNGHAPVHVPIVWDSVDCISYLFRQTSSQAESMASRNMARFELARTERLEGRMVASFDRTMVTSQMDKQELSALNLNKNVSPQIEVLPNGVDVDFFKPDSTVFQDPLMLVVSGKMSYHANVAMVLYLVREIMPLIWAVKPEVRLTIVGKNPSGAVAALDEHPSIAVTGTVADIRPYLLKASVALVPLQYGAGIQNKILEAMACGLPVVTTPLAVGSLSAVAGEDIEVASDPEEFAAAVLHLLAHEEHRRRLGQAGRRYVETYHRWSEIASDLEEVYRDVVNA